MTLKLHNCINAVPPHVYTKATFSIDSHFFFFFSDSTFFRLSGSKLAAPQQAGQRNCFFFFKWIRRICVDTYFSECSVV